MEMIGLSLFGDFQAFCRLANNYLPVLFWYSSFLVDHHISLNWLLKHVPEKLRNISGLLNVVWTLFSALSFKAGAMEHEAVTENQRANKQS